MTSAGKPRRILVVEDEMLVAMLIEDMLTQLGHTVVGPVAHLEPALKAAEHEAVDAALLDVNLDGRSVYPVAEVLRARAIPLAFVTGYDSDSLTPPWDEAPILEKPFQCADLDRLLNALWQRPQTHT